MLLSELLAAERVRVPLAGRTKDEVLRELVGAATAGQPQAVFEAVLQSVHDREQVLSTGIGGGIAIPHGRTPFVEQLIVAAGVCAEPLEFDALDGAPVSLCFLLVGPESAAGAHVRTLSRISRLLRRDTLRSALSAAPDAAGFLHVVRESEAS